MGNGAAGFCRLFGFFVEGGKFMKGMADANFWDSTTQSTI
jgi:hypothetical protein